MSVENRCKVGHWQPQIDLDIPTEPLHERGVESVPYADGEGYRAEDGEYHEKESPQRVYHESRRLEEQFQKFAEEVSHGLFYAVHSSFHVHPSHSRQVLGRPAEFVQLLVKLLVADQVSGLASPKSGGGSAIGASSIALTLHRFTGLRIIASLSSLSFCSRYSFMSKVCVSSILCVPCTTGDSTAFNVPITTVGKNMMQKPMAKGLNRGNTSTDSAFANDKMKVPLLPPKSALIAA